LSNFITAKARIAYDKDNWMRAITSFDFKRLYAYFMLKKGVRLDIGSQYGCHISVIKGERPLYPEFWKYKNHKIIEFKYEPSPYGNNNKHVWVDVYCDELNEIRQKLGLQPRRKFHITIGRLI